ncbi:hypothetical protein ARMSODRAFT_1017577 [Armillaria solidipes]|uniref:Uncharacterized protein n=1 Tax=Armillaria solidipes TaxID=1076256 RepID=A0A2H3BIR8_9AGAR|nr:hypothetical protein ARMSODRAFT_1017577 [Armillaria solidipes]
MSVSDRNTFVLLQEKLIQECMVHEWFAKDAKLDSATSAQEWKKCFKTIYKNFGDSLKTTWSLQQSEVALGLLAGRAITITDEAIHKLGKMLRLSGNLTGPQWFEL